MGTLLRGANWILVVWGREHHPVHFHIIGPDFDAAIELATFDVLDGELPRKVSSEALNWAAANRDTIRKTWNRLNPHLSVEE